MQRTSSFATLLFFLILLGGIALGFGLYRSVTIGSTAVAVIALVVASIVARAVRVASAWDRAVVLRLGKFRALRGPGLFGIIPIIDTIPYWIDVRVITSSFKAEKTLTKDTVPVDVDAVMFWKVIDPEKAALAVADYTSAINWAAQTALRDVIGKTVLADMLAGREKISSELQQIIDARTEPWGVNVISVEVRNVLIPMGLEDAMSMQAERERQARVILGDSERQVAEKFAEAAQELCQRPDRTAPARDEDAVPGAQAERDDRARAEHGTRDVAARRHRRNHGPRGHTRQERRVEGSAADPLSETLPLVVAWVRTVHDLGMSRGIRKDDMLLKKTLCTVDFSTGTTGALDVAANLSGVDQQHMQCDASQT
jgi:regulator of protease activity HflC (stomatin/prohibitin superfamily)